MKTAFWPRTKDSRNKNSKESSVRGLRITAGRSPTKSRTCRAGSRHRSCRTWPCRWSWSTERGRTDHRRHRMFALIHLSHRRQRFTILRFISSLNPLNFIRRHFYSRNKKPATDRASSISSSSTLFESVNAKTLAVVEKRVRRQPSLPTGRQAWTAVH